MGYVQLAIAVIGLLSASGSKGAAPAHAEGGFLSNPVDHSHWTVNIGDGLTANSPVAIALVVGAVYLGAKWIGDSKS